MKYSVWMLIFLFSTMATARDIEGRRSEILGIIDEELREVRNISKQYRHQNPRLLLRIAELYLEKARLLKDREQKKYLAIPPKQRGRISQKRFFMESTRYFTKAQKICQRIIRKFRGFKLKSEVYYILAFNAKEFDRKGEAKKYFLRALRNANKSSPVYKKSSLALAEIYYNEHNYSKALPLYESGVKGRKDKWWTKDAFNMAWSYYKRKQFSKAIDLMNEIHRLSARPNYIDMRSRVEADIGLFYVSANRLDEGIKFYRDLGKDLSSQFLRIGKILMDRDQPVQAEKVLVEAKRNVDGLKGIEVDLTLLGLFQKYKKYRKHLKVAQEIQMTAKAGGLKDEQMEVFIFHLKKVGGILQRQVLEKTHRPKKKALQKKAKLAAEYFSLLAKVSPQKNGKYLYLKAETYYAAKMMEPALKAYQQSFEHGRKQGNRKQVKLSVEGMMATLADKNLPSKIKDEYYILVYKSYLSIDPKSKKAEAVYQRIFQVYVEKQDFKNAEKVLKSYKASFPKNMGTQEAMIAKIMGHYRKTGNRKAFTEWVMKIKNKEYYVSRKYGKRLSSLLLTMQFDGIEKAASSGDKKRALKGYWQIYHDSTSSHEAKQNAAHNIAVLYFELGHADDTYQWANRSLSLMGDRVLRKFAGTYLAISTELFNMQRFEKSARLSEKVYYKLCKQKSKEKTSLYKSSYIVYLSAGKLSKAHRVINSGLKCKIPARFIEKASFQMLKVLGEQKKWRLFESHLNKLKNKASMRGKIITQMALLRDSYLQFSERARAARLEKEMESIYQKARMARQKISVGSLWKLAQIRLRKMQALVKQFNKIQLIFPQKKFDARLGKKIDLLDKIAHHAEKVFKTKSGKGSIKAYQLLIESYQKLIRELREFNVIGKNESYVATFKKAMKQIENPLMKKSLQYLKEARALIAQGKVLSPDSYWFVSRNRIPVNVEYHFTGSGILMDREGKR